MLFAAVVVRKALISRPVANLMGIAGLTFLAQGWLAGAEGFSHAHTSAIVSAKVLDAVWMTWLLIAASRMRNVKRESPGR